MSPRTTSEPLQPLRSLSRCLQDPPSSSHTDSHFPTSSSVSPPTADSGAPPAADRSVLQAAPHSLLPPSSFFFLPTLNVRQPAGACSFPPRLGVSRIPLPSTALSGVRAGTGSAPEVNGEAGEGSGQSQLCSCFQPRRKARKEEEEGVRAGTDFTHHLVHHADIGVPPTITNRPNTPPPIQQRSGPQPCPHCGPRGPLLLSALRGSLLSLGSVLSSWPDAAMSAPPGICSSFITSGQPVALQL